MTRIEKLLWIVAALWACAALVPANHWYDAHDIRIDDLSEGETLELLYSGGAVRNFIGSYAVIIRDTDTRMVVGEDRSARFPYQVDSTRPVPLTIDWWAPGDARMHALPPGRYQMETCWTVHDAFWGLVPPKTTCSESNIFQVHAVEPPQNVFTWPEAIATN